MSSPDDEPLGTAVPALFDAALIRAIRDGRPAGVCGMIAVAHRLKRDLGASGVRVARLAARAVIGTNAAPATERRALVRFHTLARPARRP
ncbi:hypothetical protein NYR55_06210 [Sphingomonas sp. BGYR3]|uniref:hypothetical protein n=1 Tax=Sphingomonas sp. BGYR3 TaxID=2975483 RepID=UPI0021A492AC|nr:hypothetical protein [Sphingomonas sp. BGYR3]MDG5488212.1 hypothetical protein [Sphingomonas sp. BGYR3]